jgi:drug/metabolite transporter (DMT)-like permease
MRREEWRGLAFAAAAVAFFSTSPVLTLWAEPLDPFVKTGGRMAVAALTLGSVLALTHSRAPAREAGGEPAPLDPAVAAPAPLAPRSRSRTVTRFAVYGLIAALHFLCYIASLSFTSPAQSLTIVYTAPIFVALFAALLLREPIRRRQWGGMVVAVLGIAVLANPLGLEAGYPDWVWGDLLALGSAITFGLYSVAGRYERARYSLFQYATGLYGAAALWLLPVALLRWPQASGPPVAAGAWLAVLALGRVPLALGHTLYNASLRRVHAAYVNIIAAQEVTGGVLMSWLFLGIAPTANEITGALITLGGILIVLR